MQTANATKTVPDKDPRFPMRLVLMAAVITVGLALWDAWADHAGVVAHSAEDDRVAETSFVAARILHLDEVLTMSARMAAETGETVWIDRYRQFEPELGRLIERAESLAPGVEGLDSADATAEANEALVKMEEASFELVLQGRKAEARALLSGPDYVRWKQAYAAGMDSFLRAVTTQRRDEAEDHQRRVWKGQIVHGASMALLVGLWCFILWRVASTWRAKASRHQAVAEALGESEKRFLDILYASSDAILLIDNERFVDCNEATARMLGYATREEFLMTHPSELSPPTQPDGRPSLEKANEMMTRAFEEGFHRFEWTHRKANGDDFPVEVSLTPVAHQGKTILHCVWRDITERKRLEEEAAQANERLKAILMKCPFGVVVIGRDRRIRWANETARTMAGVENQAVLLGHDCGEYLCPAEQNECPVLDRGQDVDRSERILRRNMREIPILKTVLETKIGGEDVLLETFIDITDQKQAEKALQEARRAADAANAAKSDFLANMSHEIRTPMTAILGFAEMLGNAIECCNTCPEHETCMTRLQNKEHIRIIQRNGEHLLRLINDILDLSKIEAGRLQVERTPCSPVQLVEEVVSLMRVRAIEKGLALDAHYEFPLPATIAGDSARIRQILTNLTGNAVKFSERGDVAIAVRCVTDAELGQARLSFAVEDAGIGMTPEEIEQLFQPFVQADASTTRRYGGTGLGLSISKRLAQALGGDIQVESRPAEGSTFTFTMEAELPGPVRMLQDISEVAARPSPSSQSAPVAVKLQGRILLAEDGQDNRMLISAILRMAGAEVDSAANGRLAVEMALAARSAGTPYDAILMDMQMPEMDGYQATGRLRQLGYEGAIIALTAHAMSEDRSKCLAAGCDEYATKPVDRVGLLQMLSRLMGCQAEGHDEPSAKALSVQPSSDEPVRSQFADDPDMRDLIDGFVARLPQTLAAMAEALKSEVHEELRRLAHQLKGAGGGFGYPMLTEEARRLEDAAKAADVRAATAALNRLHALCRGVVAGHEAPEGEKP